MKAGEYKIREFELCNHLGNVMVTVSDRKLPKDTLGDNSVDHFRADVLSAGDYYAFGMQMPGRNFNSSSYRFGYNAGSEKDDEITGVTGSHFTTFFREFDTRILKPWTPDPVFQPWQSPYSYMDGNPILFNDPLGNDIDPTASGYDDAKKKATPEYKKGKDGKVLYKKDGVTPKKQINNDYNEEFAKQFNNLKDNHSIMVKFEHIGNETDVGGTVSFDEINAVDQNVYSVKWNPNLTTELGASGIFEETFHLIDGLEGKNFKIIMGGGVDKFDLYDEARAKEWVVNNVKIKDNYSPETGYTNYTHYGYFKSQLKVNSKEGIVRLLHDGNKIFNQSTDIPSIGYNNVYYEKGYKFFFGGRYGKMSTEDLKVSDQ
jgi:hypothetical protein